MEENPPRRRRLSDAPNPTDPPLHYQHTSPSLPPPLVVPPHRHVHYSTTDDEEEEEGDHNGVPWQEKVRAHRIAGARKDSSLDPIAPVEVPLEQESTMDERETFAGGVGVSYLDGEVVNGNKRLPSPSPSPPPPSHPPIPATAVLARRERRQEKRSMTLPDEFMNGTSGAGGVPLDKLDTSEGGYGFGFGPSVRRSSFRLAHGAGTAAATAAVANKNNNLVSSPSSDDQGSFRRDRQERLHSSSSSPLAIGGPSRYPGMLQLQHPSSSSPLALASVDSAAVSPRTVQRRRMVSSRGGSPDIEHRNRDGNGNASIPAPAARLRRRISSMDDLTAEAGASRRKSNSWNAKHDMLPATTTKKMKMGSGESTTTPTTLTPTSTRPPSRHRKESMMQAVHPINASSSSKATNTTNNNKQRQQGSRDTGGDGDNSSTHGPSGDESMNEEKQEFAKTVGRKRKQSEDFAVAAADRLRHQHQHQHLHLQQHLHPSQPQRSMSTPVTMSAVPEFTEYGLQGNSTSNPPLMPQESKEKEPARTKKRSRRGVEGLGFEGTLEASQQRTQNDAASSGKSFFVCPNQWKRCVCSKTTSLQRSVND